jgi:holo-[acyl-carrier protein] synthase
VIVGIGVDVVEIERMRELLARKGERALARLFTPAERAYAETHVDPPRHLAARAAAKEAAFKALSGNDMARGIGWRELEVVSQVGRAPTLALHGRADARAKELGVTTVHLSLTHGREVATAFVVVERGD